MLPDHALPALPRFVIRHALDGCKRVEVARCEWGGKFFRSTQSGSRTGQYFQSQHLRATSFVRTQQCFRVQQKLAVSDVRQCRNMETQWRNDDIQYGRSRGSCRARRAGIIQRASFGVVHGWSLSIWISSSGNELRVDRSRTWRAYIYIGGGRCRGSATETQQSRSVLRATTFDITQTVSDQSGGAASLAEDSFKIGQGCAW